MWNRKELKARGKAAFRANYWPAVLAGFIAIAVVGGGYGVVGSRTSSAGAEQGVTSSTALENIPPEVLLAIFAAVLGVALVTYAVVFLIFSLLFNPLKVGCSRFFLVNADGPAKLEELLYGYQSNYGNMVKTLMIRDIFLWLWSMLFIIPGAVKSLSYRMVPYILADNPNMSSLEAITLSRQMMNGHKWKTFVLDLSFLGWNFLTILTCGLVGVLYAGPYELATGAELYKTLRATYTETV